jgi:hypothetical protein
MGKAWVLSPAPLAQWERGRKKREREREKEN